MVHGRTAYIVACGPLKNGAKPGNVCVCGKSAVSSAVYKGLTVMPSGVSQFNRFMSPSGADLAAAFSHSWMLCEVNVDLVELMADNYGLNLDAICKIVGHAQVVFFFDQTVNICFKARTFQIEFTGKFQIVNDFLVEHFTWN